MNDFYNLEMLVVTCRYDDGSLNCDVMPVELLVKLYGLSDCPGNEEFKVWGMDEQGELHRLYVYGSYEAPFNRMVMENSISDIVGVWEWPEH